MCCGCLADVFDGHGYGYGYGKAALWIGTAD